MLWVFQEGMVSSVNKTDDFYHLDRFNLDEISTLLNQVKTVVNGLSLVK